MCHKACALRQEKPPPRLARCPRSRTDQDPAEPKVNKQTTTNSVAKTRGHLLWLSSCGPRVSNERRRHPAGPGTRALGVFWKSGHSYEPESGTDSDPGSEATGLAILDKSPDLCASPSSANPGQCQSLSYRTAMIQLGLTASIFLLSKGLSSPS